MINYICIYRYRKKHDKVIAANIMQGVLVLIVVKWLYPCPSTWSHYGFVVSGLVFSIFCYMIFIVLWYSMFLLCMCVVICLYRMWLLLYSYWHCVFILLLGRYSNIITPGFPSKRLRERRGFMNLSLLIIKW